MSQNETIDDTSSLIRYEPASAWESTRSLGAYGPFNGTIRGTAQEGASATFSFRGSSVSVSCLLWPTGANFTATLDSESLGTFDTSVSSSSDATVKVLVTKDGLDGSAEHVLVITKAADHPGWVSTVAGDRSSHLNIDSFTVTGVPTSGGGSTSNSGSSSSSSKPPIGAIVGAVIGGVGLLVLIGIFLWRRKRKGPHPLIHVTPAEAPIQRDETQGRVLDVSADRREKVAVRGLESPSQELAGGRWRSSWFQLPGHRIVHAGVLSDEERQALPLQRVPSASASSLRTGSAPPARTLVNERQPTVLSAGTENTDLHQPSVVPGHRDAVTPHSPVPPSTVISSGSSPLPVSTPGHSNNEKSTIREESGTGSLPSATETNSSAVVLPRATSATTGTGEPMTAALLQELAGLREQVRHLTQIQQRQILGGSAYSDGNDLNEPPPEYVGRDSDEHSRV